VPPRKYQGVAFGMPRLYHCARLQRPGFFCWSIRCIIPVNCGPSKFRLLLRTRTEESR
jgi:hypothetical protein